MLASLRVGRKAVGWLLALAFLLGVPPAAEAFLDGFLIDVPAVGTFVFDVTSRDEHWEFGVVDGPIYSGVFDKATFTGLANLTFKDKGFFRNGSPVNGTLTGKVTGDACDKITITLVDHDARRKIKLSTRMEQAHVECAPRPRIPAP